MRSCSICLSLSDSFHLAYCPPSPSVLLQMAKCHSFLCLCSIPFCVCACVCASVCAPHLIYPFIHWWTLTLLPYLTTVNNSTVNIGQRVSFQISVFVFFGYTPRNGISGSHSSVLVFWETSLHSDCTNIHSHQQCTKIPFLLHPWYHLLFVFFLMIAILTGMSWHLIVILISISLMA